MTTRQLELDSLLFLIIAAVVGSVMAVYFSNHPYSSQKISLPGTYDAQVTTPTPETPDVAAPQISTQISPDGSKVFMLRTATNTNESKTYTAYTSDEDGSNVKMVYEATYLKDSPESISIPFNTWSPDDKYVFLDHNSASGTEAVVLNADGSSLVTPDLGIDVTNLFSAKHTDVHNETTGWASDTLLVINTQKPDGEKGTSYWFEVPSKAIIPLATQF